MKLFATTPVGDQVRRGTTLGILVAFPMLAACGTPVQHATPKGPNGPAPAAVGKGPRAPSTTDAKPKATDEEDEDEESEADAVARNAKQSEMFRHPIALPGCTSEGVTEVLQRIQRIEGRFSAKAPAASATAEAIRGEIRAVWAHPCLTHLARIYRAPSSGTFEELSDLWHRGLNASLRASVGALYMRRGVSFLVVPPENASPLSADARRALATWICPEADLACGGHSASYVKRAEEAFDDAEQRAHGWAGGLDHKGSTSPMPGAVTNYATAGHLCPEVPDLQYDQTGVPKTPFESFALCTASEAPRTWRYPQGVRLRAPEKGWLVVRGRRGHYSFTDEVSALDLATGAAYIARSGSALVLSGISVDFAAVDAKRKLEVVTGTVAPDQVRELAFVLATAKAVRAKRTEIQLVPVSKQLPITLTPSRGAAAPFDVADAEWGSSAHTTLRWQLIDGSGAVAAEGNVMWPSSPRQVETHADGLLRVVEAGLSPGCAPARLPASLGLARGRAGAVHPIDADPNAQVDVFVDLARKLEDASKKACPNVKP